MCANECPFILRMFQDLGFEIHLGDILTDSKVTLDILAGETVSGRAHCQKNPEFEKPNRK